MKKYEEPIIEVIVLKTEDVITASTLEVETAGGDSGQWSEWF